MSRKPAAEQAPTLAVGALPRPAAGIISRRIDVRITEAGVTGVLRKGARR